MSLKFNKESILSNINNGLKEYKNGIPSEEYFKELLESSNSKIHDYIRENLVKGLSSNYYSVLNIFECPLANGCSDVYIYYNNFCFKYGSSVGSAFLRYVRKYIKKSLIESNFFITTKYACNTKFIISTSLFSKIRYLICKKYIGWVIACFIVYFMYLLFKYNSIISEAVFKIISTILK